ncbi:hypothetical protein [Haloarcula sp. JP-L23]|uniref:hypothetical protein n=1 Tax=Haloarcula sp. JP-L23 TaxID=2716717 RepID=UPI00140F166C|nr:hypothetical protein G9465_12245 [Haloarcula sp. JP-L23]
MNRREILLSVGATASVAGCSTGALSDQNSSGSGTTPVSKASKGSQPVGSSSKLDGLKVTVTDARLASRFVTEPRTYRSVDGTAYLLAHFRAETVGGEATSHPTATDIVAIVGDQQRQPMVLGSDITEPVSGKSYSGTSDARPGVVSEGWLAYEVSRDTSSAVVSWSSPNTAASSSWSAKLSPEDLPNVSIAGFNGPSKPEKYRTISLSVQAENTGGQTGQVNARIVSDILRTDIPVNFEVPAGETVAENIDVEYPSDSPDSANFRLVRAGTENQLAKTTVNYLIPVRSFGKSIKTPEGASVTISPPRFSDRLEYEGRYRDADRAGSNQQFALVRIDAEASTESSAAVPIADALRAEVNSSSYSAFDTPFDASIQYPVSGGTYDRGFASIEAGQSDSGWIVFQVPDSASASSLSVVWDHNPMASQPLTVRWSE